MADTTDVVGILDVPYCTRISTSTAIERERVKANANVRTLFKEKGSESRPDTYANKPLRSTT